MVSCRLTTLLAATTFILAVYARPIGSVDVESTPNASTGSSIHDSISGGISRVLQARAAVHYSGLIPHRIKDENKPPREGIRAKAKARVKTKLIETNPDLADGEWPGTREALKSTIKKKILGPKPSTSQGGSTGESANV